MFWSTCTFQAQTVGGEILTHQKVKQTHSTNPDLTQNTEVIQLHIWPWHIQMFYDATPNAIIILLQMPCQMSCVCDDESFKIKLASIWMQCRRCEKSPFNQVKVPTGKWIHSFSKVGPLFPVVGFLRSPKVLLRRTINQVNLPLNAMQDVMEEVMMEENGSITFLWLTPCHLMQNLLTSLWRFVGHESYASVVNQVYFK